MHAAVWVAGSALVALAQDPAALEQRARQVDAECSAFEERGRRAVEAGDTAAALREFGALVERREASPYLATDLQRVGLTADSVEGRAFAFMQRAESRLREAAVALRAYAEWRAGRAEAQRGLRSQDARQVFAGLLAERAGFLFEHGNYAEAARVFGAAGAAHRAGFGPAPDREYARLQYNQALAEANAGRPAEASRLLERIRAAFPDYRSQEIAARIQALAHGAGR